MANLLLSKFETYLLDEELGVDSSVEAQEPITPELLEREEFPNGFFTSL